jgi:hypothetical protein
VNAHSVHFDIRRVTLHGYSASERARFMNTLNARLTDLGQGDNWSLAAGRIVRRVDAGTLRPGAGPEAAAAQVAARLRSTLMGKTTR